MGAELMNITEKADAKFLEIRQTLKVDSEIGTKVLFWNDARNVTDKYERADMYRDQDHDDWLKLVDDLSYDKKALPDKENSVKVERKLEEQRKKEAAKKEMELLFERPEDERPENNESGKYSYGVDEIREVTEKRNNAVPISYDQDGNISKLYRPKKDKSDLDYDSESELSELDLEEAEKEFLDEEGNENYDFDDPEQAVLPPKFLSTFIRFPEKIGKKIIYSWLRSVKAISNKTRKATYNNLMVNICQFVLFRCDELDSIEPLKEFHPLICHIIVDKHCKNKFLELLKAKWDSISDRACPIQSQGETELDRCYSKIMDDGEIQKDEDEILSESEKFLNFGDYAAIVLTRNVLPFNRFKGPFITQIWRTFESIFLDNDYTNFKLDIINLFLPLCKNRFWTPAIHCLKNLLLNSKV